MTELTEKRPRLHLLDAVRGFMIIVMIVFHAAWDLKYLMGVEMPWFTNHPGIWNATRAVQQIGCSVFIFLSGLCYPLSRSHLRRGLITFGAGALVTAVTVLVSPQSAVLFGVLTFLGSAMLLFVPIDALWKKRINRGALPSALAAAVCLAVFVFTKDLALGGLGFERLFAIPLPAPLYEGGLLGAYVGFTPTDFFSSDYFPLLPWLGLFGAGYFLSPLLIKRDKPARLLTLRIPPLCFLGRHSLLIYLLHQPVLTLLFTLIGML